MNEIVSQEKHSPDGKAATAGGRRTPEPSQANRKELRSMLIGENAQKALEFQNLAVQKFGPEAGIFIRQVVFWDTRGRTDDEFFYKSRREMQRETGLNQRWQEKARKRLREEGVLEEDVRPVGTLKRPTLHYKPVYEALLDLLHPMAEDVSTTGHGAERDFSAYPSVKPPVEDVSTTGHSPDTNLSPYLSEKLPVEAVSSTGHEAQGDHSAYISGKTAPEAVSTIQESTAGEDDKKEPHLSPADRERDRRVGNCLAVLEEMEMDRKNIEAVAKVLPDLLARFPVLTDPVGTCRRYRDKVAARTEPIRSHAIFLAGHFEREAAEVQEQPKNPQGAGTPVFRAPEPEPEEPFDPERLRSLSDALDRYRAGEITVHEFLTMRKGVAP